MSKRFMSSNRALLLVSAIVCMLGACGSVTQNAVPVSAGEAITAPEGEYRIHAGDTLEVKFFYYPDMNEQVTVRPDGHIALQLIPDIAAAGLTSRELSESLTQRYSAALVQPELSVIVRTFSGRKFFVDGEVNTPGVFDMVGPISLRQSLAQAGGVKETARLQEIIIIRPTSAAKTIIITVNLQKINNGADPSQNTSIRPGDIVYVPRSPIANVDLWVKQYMRDLLPIMPSPSVAFP